MKVNANTLRAGNVVEMNGKLWVVLKAQNINPGKGAAVVQVELRDMRSGTKTNERFRSQESVERAQLQDDEYQYLYPDGENFAFMHTVSYEHLTVPKDIVGDMAVWLQDGMVCTIRTFEDAPVSIELPDNVILEVIEADAAVRAQTASASYKPAKLSNGVVVQVPPHIEPGTRIIVSIAEGSYLSRAKD